MRKQNGFSMLEVLVTIVIVSFGLLGIAGLIANSLKANHSSYARSQASWLANDIIDSMRANRSVAEVTASPYILAIGDSPSGSGIPFDDLTAWRAKLAEVLPSGTGGVGIDAAHDNKVVVTIQWDDSRAAGGVASQQLAVETKL